MKRTSTAKLSKLFILCTITLFSLNTASRKSMAEEIKITDIENIGEALSEAEDNASKTNPYTISVQTGNYELNEEINIPSYTTLNFEPGTKISCDGISDNYAIRITSGTENSAINGGTFQGAGIFVKDSENITIENVTVNNPSECGILVKGVNKQGSIKVNTVTNSKKFSIAFMGAEFDGNIEKNTITKSSDIALYLYNSTLKGNISGNTIKNCQKTAIYAGGTPINGDITNNTIKSVKGHGIGIYHGSHVNAIDSNNMDDIGGANNGGNGDCGIMINADEGSGKKAYPTYVKSITNNTIKNVTYSGIKLYAGPSGNDNSKANQDKAYIKKDIKGNTLYNIGTYKHSKDWKKEIQKGGRFGAQVGIYLDSHSRVYGNICDNTITKSNLHGIYMRVGAVANNITNNIITNVKEDGICINKAEKVNGSINNNKITNAKVSGLCVRENSTVNKVSGNTFKQIGYKNITILDNSKIKKNSQK